MHDHYALVAYASCGWYRYLCSSIYIYMNKYMAETLWCSIGKYSWRERFKWGEFFKFFCTYCVCKYLSPPPLYIYIYSYDRISLALHRQMFMEGAFQFKSWFVHTLCMQISLYSPFLFMYSMMAESLWHSIGKCSWREHSKAGTLHVYFSYIAYANTYLLSRCPEANALGGDLPKWWGFCVLVLKFHIYIYVLCMDMSLFSLALYIRMSI